MNLATFERAQVAAFAYRRARYTGSLFCLRAVCYILRNRIKAGWGEMGWLSVMESHPAVEGNERPDGVPMLDPQDRLLQLLIRDIDDIYLGTSEDETKLVVADALYFQMIDQPPRDWFVKNIVRQPQDHPRTGQIGPMALFR